MRLLVSLRACSRRDIVQEEARGEIEEQDTSISMKEERERVNTTSPMAPRDA